MGIELLHLQSVQSFSHSDADPNRHSDTNSYAHRNANSYAHSNANANSHAHSITNADGHSNSYSGQHSCDAPFLTERRNVFEKSRGARFLQYGGRNHLLHD